MRHLGKYIRRGGGDDKEVGIAGKFDMAHTRVFSQREKIVENPVPGQAFDGELRHEPLRRLGHHRPYKKSTLAQTPDKIQRLVSRDAAADD